MCRCFFSLQFSKREYFKALRNPTPISHGRGCLRISHGFEYFRRLVKTWRLSACFIKWKISVDCEGNFFIGESEISLEYAARNLKIIIESFYGIAVCIYLSQLEQTRPTKKKSIIYHQLQQSLRAKARDNEIVGRLKMFGRKKRRGKKRKKRRKGSKRRAIIMTMGTITYFSLFNGSCRFFPLPHMPSNGTNRW